MREGVVPSAFASARPDTILAPIDILFDFPPSGVGVVLQPAAAEKLAAAGKIQLAGDQSALTEFAGLMDDFDPNFSVITP